MFPGKWGLCPTIVLAKKAVFAPDCEPKVLPRYHGVEPSKRLTQRNLPKVLNRQHSLADNRVSASLPHEGAEKNKENRLPATLADVLGIRTSPHIQLRLRKNERTPSSFKRESPIHHLR